MTTRCLKITGSWPVDQLAYLCWSKREHRLVYYSILSPVLVCLCQPMLWSYPLNSSPCKCLRNHQFVSALVFFCIHCSANRLCLHCLLIREMTGCPLPRKSVRGGHWCYIVMLSEVHLHALEDTRGQKHYLEHFHWEMVSFQHDPSYCIVAWIRSMALFRHGQLCWYVSHIGREEKDIATQPEQHQESSRQKLDPKNI